MGAFYCPPLYYGKKQRLSLLQSSLIRFGFLPEVATFNEANVNAHPKLLNITSYIICLRHIIHAMLNSRTHGKDNSFLLLSHSRLHLYRRHHYGGSGGNAKDTAASAKADLLFLQIKNMTYEEAIMMKRSLPIFSENNNCKFFNVVLSENMDESNHFFKTITMELFEDLINDRIKVKSTNENYTVIGVCYAGGDTHMYNR